MTFWVGEKEKCFLRSSSVIYDFESCSEMNIYTVAVTSLMQYKNIVMKLRVFARNERAQPLF